MNFRAKINFFVSSFNLDASDIWRGGGVAERSCLLSRLELKKYVKISQDVNGGQEAYL